MKFIHIRKIYNSNQVAHSFVIREHISNAECPHIIRETTVVLFKPKNCSFDYSHIVAELAILTHYKDEKREAIEALYHRYLGFPKTLGINILKDARRIHKYAPEFDFIKTYLPCIKNRFEKLEFSHGTKYRKKNF